MEACLQMYINTNTSFNLQHAGLLFVELPVSTEVWPAGNEQVHISVDISTINEDRIMLQLFKYVANG